MKQFGITDRFPLIKVLSSILINVRYFIFSRNAIILFFGSFLTVYLYTTSMLQAAQLSRTLHVTHSGSNIATCGTEANPCRSIQYAINQASSGDTILVAAGNYYYDKASDRCSIQIGTTGVLCIHQKKLTIRGGYKVDDWRTPSPTTNSTTIDGQGKYRGVLVFSMTQDAQTSLILDGFTIQNGLAEGVSARIHPDDIFAFGGGMLAENVESLHLQQVIFKANKAIGSTTRVLYGGTGLGGGLAIRHVADVTLAHVDFEDNDASGGDGRERGGYAIGGGLYTTNVTLSGHHLTFVNNRVQAGSTAGSGQTNDGQRGHAYGAGASFQDGSTVTLADVTARGNQATGGSGDRYAGGAFGGAIKVEKSIFQLTDAHIENNWVIGGEAENGWLGSGGGLDLLDSETMLDRISVVHNAVQGGNGTTGRAGVAQGGGISASWRDPAYISTLIITNSVIANNAITVGTGITMDLDGGSGGGGGLFVQATNAQLNHVTLADNWLEGEQLQGTAILLSEFGSRITVANIHNSVIANHQGQATALHIRPNSQADFYTNLMAGNSRDINMEELNTVRGVDTISIVESISFVASAMPDYDYHLTPFSPAIDAGPDSTVTVDRDGVLRRETADLGAYEAVPYAIQVTPIADGTVRVFMGHYSGIAMYQITLFCPEGANASAEVGCDQSVDVIGTKNTFDLTGLSNYQNYQIMVAALNESSMVLATTARTTANVTDRFAYLPLVVRN